MDSKFYANLIYLIILLAIYIILVIAEIRIFKKAGEKGYKALIPIYNIYVSHHIVGMGHVWFIIELVLWAGEITTVWVNLNHTVELVFSVITIVFTAACEIVHAIKMCKCFGKAEYKKETSNS